MYEIGVVVGSSVLCMNVRQACCTFDFFNFLSVLDALHHEPYLMVDILAS